MNRKIKKFVGWTIIVLLALSNVIRTFPTMRIDIARGVGEFIGGLLVVLIVYWLLIKERGSKSLLV